MANLNITLESLITAGNQSRVSSRALIEYKQWCNDKLSHNERSSLNTALQSLLGKTTDDQKGEDVIHRDSGSEFCEPFWFYPRKFSSFVTLEKPKKKKHHVLHKYRHFSSFDMLPRHDGGDNYQYAIGDTVVKVKYDPSKVVDLKVKVTCHGRYQSMGFVSRGRNNRRRLRAALSHMSEHHVTFAERKDSETKYLHSKGWVVMVREIMKGYKPVVVYHSCTVAGYCVDTFVQDTLNYSYCV